MKGSIDKIWENETKDNKTYHVVNIGGENYSVWDSKLLDDLTEGSSVEYEWKKSGDYKKITDLRKIDANPGLEGPKPDRKSTEIMRMSCLRSASEVLHGLDIEPVEKTKQALDIARQFEKYVRD